MKEGTFNLMREMVVSDFKLRYQGSTLGVLWALLRPLLTFSVLYLVFSKFARFDIPHYPIYLLLGVILWNFLAEATTSSAVSLVSKAGLIKKISFPRASIVISATLTAFLNLCISFLVFFIFLLIMGPYFSWTWVFILFPLFSLYFLSLGIGFFLSSLHARFRDVLHIWELCLQIGFWLTPVVYSSQMIPTRYQFLAQFNPMAWIIGSARGILIFQQTPQLSEVVVLVVVPFVVLLLGVFIFQKREPYFAEEL